MHGTARLRAVAVQQQGKKREISIRGRKFEAVRLVLPVETINPVLLIDHFWMDKPTFPPHKHAGIAALSIMFEDSECGFSNRDSFKLGDRIIAPGELQWTISNKGIVHEEIPDPAKPGKTAHGAQILMNIPEASKLDKPQVIHLNQEDIPVLTPSEGARVRVLSGSQFGLSPETKKRMKPPIDITLLDCILKPSAVLDLEIPEGRVAWAMVIKGSGSTTTMRCTEEGGLKEDQQNKQQEQQQQQQQQSLSLKESMNVVWERKGTKITISAAKESGLHLLIGHSTPLEDKGLWGGDNFGFSGVYLKV
mmetsp:Transcript_22351/g.44865  ORF Transcript_22351/g.44865 Transcript_22351/m.44865 type:complete len:306 (+) Transcript_22351:154-1071(+)